VDPRIDPVAEALVARGEVLRAMIEPKFVGAARGQPSPRPTALVEYCDRPSLPDQPFGADQSGQAGADDGRARDRAVAWKLDDRWIVHTGSLCLDDD
jgi:hypothetical protein